MSHNEQPAPSDAFLESLAEALQERCEDEAILDELVHDAKASEAADVNNAGLAAQLRYLCQGMTDDEAAAFARKVG